MAKADLHCHSIYSEHPSEWFLQRLGAAESYTEPEFLLKELEKRNMDFITITDHNRIEGAIQLKKKYPEKVIVGLEATAYFPEDRCKVHILIYGLDKEQFDEIQSIRTNIYVLRDYLRNEELTHSVAHATYAVNGKLTIEHLEKLLVLFDVFEVRNGGRNPLHNDSWLKILQALKPEHIAELSKKHNIDPFGDDSWNKGFTAGSDDHGGIFLGTTYTENQAKTAEEFLSNIRNKRSTFGGRQNDFKGLAFTLYKIALDFGKYNHKIFSNSFFGKVSDFIFNDDDLSLIDKLKINNMSKRSKRNDDILRINIMDLVKTLQKEKHNGIMTMEKRFDIAYNKISNITDSFFKVLLESFEKNLNSGNLLKIIRNISSTLPGIFITLPFFSTIHHLYDSREMLAKLSKKFAGEQKDQTKKVLWFSDTVEDLNGVSVTLKKVQELSSQKGYSIKVVGNRQLEKDDDNFINLPIMHKFELPYYEHQLLKIPSPLTAMEKIYQENPDKIIISTPGPIGLLALLATKLFHIKSVGIYHTDFKLQTKGIKEDASLISLVDGYTHWFYQQLDEIYVPSHSYIDILEERGFKRSRTKIFPRGIDYNKFYPKNQDRTFLLEKHKIDTGKIFLYTGRISHDKNLEIILKAMQQIQEKQKNIYLLLVGDGPHKKELEKKYANPKIIFTGKVQRSELPDYYSNADLFLFPSTTDTFGMSVLEAQACCLTAFVSHQGGPKEIIEDKKTGFVIPSLDDQVWKDKIEEFIQIMENEPDRIMKMRMAARDNVMKKSSWDKFFQEFVS